MQHLQLHSLHGYVTICSVLYCAAVCCSVLQCVAVSCSVLQCVAVCCHVLQCIAECCCSLIPTLSFAPRIHDYSRENRGRAPSLQCIAVGCSVLQQYVAVCCSVQPTLSFAPGIRDYSSEKAWLRTVVWRRNLRRCVGCVLWCGNRGVLQQCVWRVLLGCGGPCYFLCCSCCAYTPMHTCKHIQTRMHTHTDTDTHMHTHKQACTHMHTHALPHICIYKHAHVLQTYTHIQIHVQIHAKMVPAPLPKGSF